MNKEEKWWNKFCKVLDDMPDSMEIIVDAYGGIDPAKRGSTKKCFDKNGDVDNVETMTLGSWRGKGVENVGSSL